MIVAATFFFLSCIGIISLFALKYWEMRRARVLFPSMRQRLDARALQFKELLGAVRVDLAKVPPVAIALVRILVHEAALAFAATARFAERQAHRLADMVSYKHRFEKRETRSEFQSIGAQKWERR